MCGPSLTSNVSLERRFGGGLLALGIGQLVLGAASAVEPGPVQFSTWTTLFLWVCSLGLGALVVSGRLPLKVTDGQRRPLQFIGTASLVGGIGTTLAGLLLLGELFLI